MKIGHLDPNGTPGPLGDRETGAVDGRKNGTRATAGPAAAPAGEPSARVELSRAAASLHASAGEFDAAKVDRVASAIREGRYEVNAEVIADKLIANAQELLVRNPR